MHIVGLRYYSASDARRAKALAEGAVVNFRQHYESAEHPDAYRAFCKRFLIGHMPRFASRLLVAAGGPSPVAATVRSVSGRGKSVEVIVDIKSPLSEAPAACSLQTPAPAGWGVYAIVNARNMKAYIGCTENFETRRKQHLQALNQGSHFSPGLQRDWHQNPTSFSFIVLDESPDDLLKKEHDRKYIYHTEDPAVGYNQGRGFAPAFQPRPSSTTMAPSPGSQHRTGGSSWQVPYAHTTPTSSPAVGNPQRVFAESVARPAPPKAPQHAGCMVLLAVLAGGIALTGLWFLGNPSSQLAAAGQQPQPEASGRPG